RAALCLYPSDVTDARALWVNPAGSGRFEEASLHLDLTVGEPGAAGRLRQLTLGLSSRGLSFGYQRDVFDAGARGHTYRIGYAVGRAGLAAGFATALYRGGTDRALRRAGLALGVSLGSQALGGIVATAPGDADRIDALDLYGVSTRRFTRTRAVRD